MSFDVITSQKKQATSFKITFFLDSVPPFDQSINIYNILAVNTETDGNFTADDKRTFE